MIETLQSLNYHNILMASVFLIAGVVFSKLAQYLLTRALEKRLSKQQMLLISRFSYYLIFILFLVSALQQLGLKLGVLLGAAGIFSVAIGFASQTSFANLISGIFLLMERPFVIGDYVKIGEVMGEVMSIDILSTKIRSFDNTMFRVPNDTLIKSQIQNMTHFRKRRIDTKIGVSYDTDITKAKQVLLQCADMNSAALKTPEPFVITSDFLDSCINLQLSVWCNSRERNKMRSELMQCIQESFAKNNIEIPFPQITINKPVADQMTRES